MKRREDARFSIGRQLPCMRMLSDSITGPAADNLGTVGTNSTISLNNDCGSTYRKELKGRPCQCLNEETLPRAENVYVEVWSSVSWDASNGI